MGESKIITLNIFFILFAGYGFQLSMYIITDVRTIERTTLCHFPSVLIKKMTFTNLHIVIRIHTLDYRIIWTIQKRKTWPFFQGSFYVLQWFVFYCVQNYNSVNRAIPILETIFSITETIAYLKLVNPNCQFQNVMICVLSFKEGDYWKTQWSFCNAQVFLQRFTANQLIIQLCYFNQYSLALRTPQVRK